MSMFKILFVCDHSMKLVGGSQESLKVVLDGLKNEYDMYLFTPGLEKYSDERVVHYHYSKYGSMKTMIRHPISFIHYYYVLRNNIKESKYDLIHTHEQVGFFVLSFMKRFGLISKQIILVHTERGLLEKYGWLIKRVFGFSLKYTNALITTTHLNQKAWSEELVKRLHNNHTQCILIENTAGQRFEIYDEHKRKYKKNGIVIGFAGRYCSWKGWNLVIEICKKIKTLERVKVSVVLGCLTERDMEAGKNIEQQLSAILGERLVCNYNYDIEQMDDFYYGLDVFILTSDPHSESFGRVLVEAMSRHVAVLGTDCGGATEVIGDNKRICNTADEFVERIKMFSTNNRLLKTVKECCYRRYIENYSVENNVNKHRFLYKNLLLSK